MRGFILNDLYLIRKRLITVAIGDVFMFLVLLVLYVVASYAFSPDYISCVCAGLVFIMAYSVQGDIILILGERKKWNAYAASSEAGVRAKVGSIYMICFMISFVTYLYCRLVDIILSLISGKNVQHALFYLGCVFLITSITAIQLFLCIRFGAKYGAHIRIAMFLGLTALISIYMLFGDIEWIMGEGGIKEKALYLFEHMNDESVKAALQKLASRIIAVLCLIPHCIVALYYLSYRLSCRAYTKGAENYEK